MPISNNKVFGVFSMGELRNEIFSGNNIDREVTKNFAWFSGGGGTNSPNARSYVSRVSFNSGEGSFVGSMSYPVYRHAGVGNLNYGWFGGGYYFSTLASVSRVDFSNDLSTMPTRGALSVPRNQHAGTGNSNYGWFAGGGNYFIPAMSSVERIDFSNDSVTASPRSPLPQANSSLAATGNSNYGWFGRANSLAVDRMDFTNDNISMSPRGPLSSAAASLAAAGNTKYGFFVGNLPTSRIDFSNDYVTALTSSSSFPGAWHNAVANAGGAIVTYGGQTSPFSFYFSSTYLSFDNSYSSYLPYISNGNESYSGKQAAVSGSSKVLIRRGNFGWFGGGGSSVVDRIDFSNDSVTASTRGPLSINFGMYGGSNARTGLSATGNTNYGWFVGGYLSIAHSTVDRISFSNDLSIASTRGLLSRARFRSAATGNTSYGWFGGGYGPPAPGIRSTVDRIDFSNDSPTASVRGPLSSAKYSSGATGNSNYGWFGGGSVPSGESSTVERIDFSNDSATASPRGRLSTAKRFLSATGNSNYGWFGGGFIPSGPLSTVDRIDFSNDTGTASVRGPLSLARSNSAATGNSNYGWFGGGSTPPTVSAVDRIDFSNDSATASPRGPLILARAQLSATSNTAIG